MVEQHGRTFPQDFQIFPAIAFVSMQVRQLMLFMWDAMWVFITWIIHLAPGNLILPVFQMRRLTILKFMLELQSCVRLLTVAVFGKLTFIIPEPCRLLPNLLQTH